MFKNLSKIERDMDRVRERMWRKAGRNPKVWFALVREKAEKGLKEIKK